MKKHSVLLAIVTMVAVAAAALYAYHYYVVDYVGELYAVAIAAFVGLSFWSMYFLGELRGLGKKKKIVAAVISVAACAGVVMNGVAVILNNILRIGEKNVAMIFLSVMMVYFFVLCIMQVAASEEKKKGRKAVAVLLAIVMTLVPIARAAVIYIMSYDERRVATPAGLSEWSEEEYALVEDADFYVSSNGSDELGDGSFASPFATITRARDAVRELDKSGLDGVTVAIMAGEYRTDGIEFAEEDGGTEACPVKYCAYGDGEVKINGGMSLSAGDFGKVTDGKMLARLSEDARQNVVCVDLAAKGLCGDDWGKIYTIGSYNTAYKYDGDYVGGIYCELFYNDTRMTIARYPNEGFIEIDEVVDMGWGREDPNANVNPDWDTVRNPKGDTFRLDKSLTSRVENWATLEDVWMFGFFCYTWADASTPIGNFDADARTITTKFVSNYGMVKGATYYFYNVFEELDAPGEWYLDRDTGMMYLYPTSDIESASIDLSLSENELIKVENANYLTFEKLTVCGTRSDAIYVEGNNITISKCLVKNVSGNAVVIEGYNNSVENCEITHTGKGGVLMSGGDTETLTSSGSRVYNNFVHDWSEIYSTYQPAFGLGGVNVVCAHNEIYNSPHEAITYSGNNHIIEYNNIHDVCLLSDDAGAIYAGKSSIWYGNIIRYNCIYNLGADGHAPSGIYMDDGLAGQTIYGNILVNIPNNAIQLGGGRDLKVTGNIVINSGHSFSYDDRVRNGATVADSRWREFKEGGYMWTNLFDSPWQSEIWQNAYPEYKAYEFDFSDTETPNFAPNPANSTVSGNVFFTRFGIDSRDVVDVVNTYSDLTGNMTYDLYFLDGYFTDADAGDYSIPANSPILKDLPNFEAIPIEKIGRE